MKNVFKPYLFFPLAVMGLLFSLVGWTYFLSMGSVPFTVRNVGLETIDGQPKTVFEPGEIVGVRRELCSDRDIGVQFFPSLRTERHAMINLGPGAALVDKGCSETVFLFAVPTSLPPGRYTYNNLVKYQSNLIGRDETTAYPPLQFEVTRD